MAEERIEVYSYYPRKLHGTISRYALRAIGMTASTERISATKTQIEIFSKQPTWEAAK